MEPRRIRGAGVVRSDTRRVYIPHLRRLPPLCHLWSEVANNNLQDRRPRHCARLVVGPFCACPCVVCFVMCHEVVLLKGAKGLETPGVFQAAAMQTPMCPPGEAE